MQPRLFPDSRRQYRENNGKLGAGVSKKEGIRGIVLRVVAVHYVNIDHTQGSISSPSLYSLYIGSLRLASICLGKCIHLTPKKKILTSYTSIGLGLLVVKETGNKVIRLGRDGNNKQGSNK